MDTNSPDFWIECAKTAYRQGDAIIADKFLVIAQQCALGMPYRWPTWPVAIP